MGGESIGTNRSTSGSTGRLAPTTETNGLPEKNKVRRKRGGGGRGEKTSSSGSPGKKASADSKAGVRNQDDRLDNNDSDALAIQSRGRTGKRSEQGTQRPVLRSPKVVADNGKGSSRGSTRKRGGRKNLATENGTENSSEAANASKKSSKRSHTKSKRKVSCFKK
ncbi:hypothetical protein SARC_00039 [Sphaeroforma arctica JP610]|uniref:Uncharacterized protein n=1 Tax=Sphaeroforma arctica JP610 TaxID=667725 RepID=A0A0L0GG30_9EUKA|nr:hypothetical protein SARC_00039 [Sphaeroforma arctica JP610]KNC87781.1 hypothetical protein SARC_00039 [Sphaeroforma arctica JP610]|eukprot:XP_014161683.1 hypothetical protein SARC_00039 [Sphaeroforma arctica JP610]